MKNRELEFRIWAIEAKKMLPWEDVFYSIVRVKGGTVSGIDEDIQVPFLSIAMMGPGFIVQQYTGLKDKNGVKIFEGDRLKHYPGFGCEWKTRESVVVFEECAFWEKRHHGISFVLSDRDQGLEVIGNIFENPLDGH